MDAIRRFTENVLEETGAYPILMFGSAIHGSGRSFLADLTYKRFVAAGIPAKRISTGEIFRRVAEENGMSIDEFMDLQTKDPERFLRLNIGVDAEIHERMEDESVESAVILDSNLAAYHAETPNAFSILVYAEPGVVGQRVFEARREGDERYGSPKEALEALVRRTEEDIRLYSAASRIVRDNFWKMVYRIAAKDMEKNLRAVLRGEKPESPFYNTSVDNSGSADESWRQIEEFLERYR